MPDERRRSIMGVVFLTVFLDMVGFSILFPLFPGMLEHYLALEGNTSAIGRLHEALRELAANDWAAVTLFGGILGSIYSLFQFLFAPLWGTLSDRFGRRRILLFTLAGTAVANLLWGFSGTFAVLVVARLLGGVMAGNISTASAAIADTTTGRDRAKGMGMLGAGIGLGFVIGPALGGGLAAWSRGIDWGAGAEWGLNPFSGCAFAALALSLVNLVWAAARFHETLPPERRGRAGAERSLNPFGTLAKLDAPGVMRASVIYFLFFTAFGAMEFTLSFLARDRFAYDEAQIAWMFVFVGLGIAFVQGGVVRRLAPRLGEQKLARTGMILTLPGFVVVGAAHSGGVLYLGLALLAVGSSFVMPSLSALVSRYAPPQRQGLALGVFRSVGSLARAIGPLLGGILYWRLSSWGPYYVGAALAVIPLVLAFALPPVPKEDTRPAADQA